MNHFGGSFSNAAYVPGWWVVSPKPQQTQKGNNKEEDNMFAQVLITDDYLTQACGMVASQFINNEAIPKSPAQFIQACNEIMADHCPYAFHYLTEVRGETRIPMGTVSIIAGMVVASRPLFMGGTEELIMGVKADE